MSSTTEDKLKEVFSRALNIPISVNFSNVEYGRTDGWDSVAHMALVAEIENEFDIMLDTEDVIDLSSFSKAKNILTGKYNVPAA